MPLYMISRPEGHKLSTSAVAATVAYSGGFALATTLFSHGLSSGDWIYIMSNVSSYSGYFIVTVASPTTFYFSTSVNEIIVDYVADADITYKVSVLDHGVVAAHNPVVYEIYSNIFPLNAAEESYTPAVVSSQEDAEGYTKLILSGNMDTTALKWLQVGGVAYQILTKISDSQVIINLAYDPANTFSGPVTTYFNNYCINVNVYCGFNPGHPWYLQKRYELAATLRFTPNQGGYAKFSISDIVRSYLTTRNKLDLDTLPNNIDFATGFYIDYWESYDSVEDGEIYTFNEDVASDVMQFEGLAINAAMPFKRQDGSAMSEWVSYDVYLAKWLTLQESMTWIVGQFMDLSMINDRFSEIQININGVLSQTLTNPGIGVLRIPLTFDTAGEYCIEAWVPGSAGSPEVTNDVTGSVPTVTSWYNLDTTGVDEPWTTGATPSVVLNGGTPFDPTRSDFLAFDFNFVAGREYTLTVRLGVVYSGGGINPRTTRLSIFNSSNVEQVNAVGSLSSSNGYATTSITFTAGYGYVKAGIRASAGSDRTVSFDGVASTDYSLSETTPEVPATVDTQITEAYCITVVEECDETFIPVTDDIRLTEDGDFRILE